MKKIMNLVLVAILICGATTFTSCSVNDDNPFIAPTDEPGAAYWAVLQSLDWGKTRHSFMAIKCLM